MRILESARTRAVARLCAGALALSVACSLSSPAEALSVASSTGAGPYPRPTVEPKGSKARPGVPAITANATVLGKEPRIAKGTGRAPKKLVVRDLVVGAGRTVGSTATVNVRYVGTLYSNGKVFDASWKSGRSPVDFPLSGVIPGFAGGIVGMKVGGRREIVIPPYLAYGRAGTGPVPPNATLVFVVDLVSFS